MAVLTIRAQRRYAVRQPVRVRKPGAGAIGGLMIELSSEGCRISNLGRGSFEVGEQVTLEVEDQKLPGRIRWSHDGIAGVRLDRALFCAQLNELIARGRGDQADNETRLPRYGT
jgi:hypothetical protein